MFEEFMKKYLGQAVDVDGKYGAQCVDLFNKWNEDYNGCRINCLPSGYAKSLAENKSNNGILNYFTETAVNNMITGTVVVYKDCKFAPKSHVCFFIKDNGNGTYQALQQNANGRMYVTIDNNPYDGIIGAFIPNQIIEERNKKNESVNSSSKLQYLNLEPSYNDEPIDSWRVYDLNVEPIAGNEKAKINPSQFGGLSYLIKELRENIAVIETDMYGTSQIYINHPACSITDSPKFECGKY